MIFNAFTGSKAGNQAVLNHNHMQRVCSLAKNAADVQSVLMPPHQIYSAYTGKWVQLSQEFYEFVLWWIKSQEESPYKLQMANYASEKL